MKTTMSKPTRRRLRRLASFALVAMVLAVPGISQVPSEPVAAPTAPAPPQCPSQEIKPGGVNDTFSTANGIEAAAPSATLQSQVGGPFADFDGTTRDVHFAHTFRLPPCKCLVGARLEFVAKALGSCPSPTASSSNNDFLTLGFSTIPGFPRWGAYLGSGNPNTSPALSTPCWGLAPLQRTFTLDLAALPTGSGQTISLLSAMQTYGYLDFYVQDDTAIDYIKLTATMCDCCRQDEKKGKAEICITKFHDKNRNGVKEGTEPLLAGWTFKATDQAGGSVVVSSPTSTAGRTCFSVPAPGVYTISEVAQPFWTQTTPANPAVVTVSLGGPAVNLLFGNWRPGSSDPRQPGGTNNQ